MSYAFDVDALIASLGGASRAAEIAGVSRCTPYRWRKTGQISSKVLAKLKSECGLSIEPYFVRRDDETEG